MDGEVWGYVGCVKRNRRKDWVKVRKFTSICVSEGIFC